MIPHKTILLVCSISLIMKYYIIKLLWIYKKNWNHPFGGWYEYVTGQKSPNLHHPTENWHETDTNFLFDPLLIPICSMHCNHWVHGKMECPPHLGLLLCCDINCSSQLYQFQRGKKRYIILRVSYYQFLPKKKWIPICRSMVIVYTDRKKIFEGK